MSVEGEYWKILQFFCNAQVIVISCNCIDLSDQTKVVESVYGSLVGTKAFARQIIITIDFILQLNNELPRLC